MNDERATRSPRDGASQGGPRRARVYDPLGAALRALPAERAGAGFTGRVLARLDESDEARRDVPGRSRGFGRRRPVFAGATGWAALAAAALAVALGFALVRGWAPPAEEAIATADSAPTEDPGAAAPGEPTARIRGGSEGGTVSPPGTRIEPAGSAGSSGEEALRPLSAPSDEPAAPGSAASADSERPPVSPPRDPFRLATDVRRAGTRGRASEGVSSTIPAADARSALERMRAEVADLRREHHAFEVALAELPEIGRDGQPVVFLGGDEGLGLVLDLGREADAGDEPEAGQRNPSL